MSSSSSLYIGNGVEYQGRDQMKGKTWPRLRDVFAATGLLKDKWATQDIINYGAMRIKCTCGPKTYVAASMDQITNIIGDRTMAIIDSSISPYRVQNRPRNTSNLPTTSEV